MQSFDIVDFVDEARKVGGDVLELFIGRQVDSLDNVFMKLSALALSKGLPRQLVEPIRPWATSSAR